MIFVSKTQAVPLEGSGNNKRNATSSSGKQQVEGEEAGLAGGTKWGGRHSSGRAPSSWEAALVASFDHSVLYKKILSLLPKQP